MMPLSQIQTLSRQLTWIVPASGVSSAFDNVMNQVASTRPGVQDAMLKVKQAQLHKEQTLFGIFSSGSSKSTKSLWNWAAQELATPASWTLDLVRVMGGSDSKIMDLTRQAAALVRNPTGTTLPF